MPVFTGRKSKYVTKASSKHRKPHICPICKSEFVTIQSYGEHRRVSCPYNVEMRRHRMPILEAIAQQRMMRKQSV